MASRPSLIVGIDPGTTLSYCAMDLNGRVVLLKSSKIVRFNEMLFELAEEGHVLAVGSDKSKNPDLIRRLAAKTGAKVITPKEDMKVEEKRKMTQGFAANNQHETDALCACLYAYNELLPLIRKVQEKTGDNPRKKLIERLVIRDGISISDALIEIEEKQPEKTIGKIEYPFEKKILSLRQEIHSLEENRRELVRENQKLRSEMKEIKSRLTKKDRSAQFLQKLSRQEQLSHELTTLFERTTDKMIVRKYTNIKEWQNDGQLDEKFAIEDAPLGWRGNKKRQPIFVTQNGIFPLDDVAILKSRNFAVIDTKKLQPKHFIIEKIIEEHKKEHAKYI